MAAAGRKQGATMGIRTKPGESQGQGPDRSSNDAAKSAHDGWSTAAAQGARAPHGRTYRPMLTTGDRMGWREWMTCTLNASTALLLMSSRKMRRMMQSPLWL